MARKRNSFAKVGIVCVVLVVALGVMGTAYSYWADVLDIPATVKSGKISGEFNQAESNDPAGSLDPDVPGIWSLDSGVPVWSGTTYGQDQASTTVTSVGTDTVTATLSNVYFCYWGSVGVTILNTGTIPVKVDTVTISATSPADPNGDKLEIFRTGALLEASHVQIEPGDEALGSAHFHMFDPALNGTSYTVIITITVVRWNK